MTNDWWVYSTAIAEHALLVENRTTGQRATVRDPSPDEWKAAFHAPSHPYRWPHPERVIVDAEQIDDILDATHIGSHTET